MTITETYKEKEVEKIWESIVLEVDNVGVVIKQKDDKWFLAISGTKELIVDITHLFTSTLTVILQGEVENLKKINVHKLYMERGGIQNVEKAITDYQDYLTQQINNLNK